MHINPGFQGKRRTDPETAQRIPPGQHLADDFPVLSAGPTPKVKLENWTFSVEGLVSKPQSWNWQEFGQLAQKRFQVDIHCVTQWSKLDTKWRGVCVADILALCDPLPEAQYLLAHCYGGYTTNLPLKDALKDNVFIGLQYEGFPLSPEHGGPARLVVPHLYFWKSAKWVQGFQLLSEDQLGFWEEIGYHAYGDPWEEQRYAGD